MILIFISYLLKDNFPPNCR